MKKLTVSQFVNERKVGLIVRGFAKNAEDVPSRVQMMDELIKKAQSTIVHGREFISRVDVMVWANRTDFPNEADCGLLAAALRAHFVNNRKVFIHELGTGDLFCSILNYGIARQLRVGCDYSVIASAEANAYWASDVPEQMVEAACKGALAVGVAINELTPSVREGRIANTMAMWHNESIVTVGGFDLRAQKPKNDKLAHYMHGVDTDGNIRFYHLGGVEEMIPLARLVDTFGKCIGIVESSDSSLQYKLPDPATHPVEYASQMAKFGTKTERQMAHVMSIGTDFSHIRHGVMDLSQ